MQNNKLGVVYLIKWCILPPSDEGGVTVGDGGRDSNIIN